LEAVQEHQLRLFQSISLIVLERRKKRIAKNESNLQIPKTGMSARGIRIGSTEMD
jgi:hypothetical protein